MPDSIRLGNLFAAVDNTSSKEVFESLVEQPGLRVERIVSTGHSTPPGEWYDQDQDEWVILLSGSSRLQFEDESSERILNPGDWIHIPARCRHRVEWTPSDESTVWLAVHFEKAGPHSGERR